MKVMQPKPKCMPVPVKAMPVQPPWHAAKKQRLLEDKCFLLCLTCIRMHSLHFFDVSLASFCLQYLMASGLPGDEAAGAGWTAAAPAAADGCVLWPQKGPACLLSVCFLAPQHFIVACASMRLLFCRRCGWTTAGWRLMERESISRRSRCTGRRAPPEQGQGPVVEAGCAPKIFGCNISSAYFARSTCVSEILALVMW